MIEPVEKYQTSDGKLHSSVAKAEAHDLDRVRELIDNKLKSIKMIQDGRLTASDRYELILALLPDYKGALALIVELDKIAN